MYLFIYLFICIFIYMFINLCIYLFTALVCRSVMIGSRVSNLTFRAVLVLFFFVFFCFGEFKN